MITKSRAVKVLQRFRAFAQTTTYLGLAVIAIIWCGVFYLTHEEHQRAYEDGVRQGSNLARIFEEYIARVVGGADSTLLALRDLYEQDPKDFDIRTSAGRAQLQDAVVQYGIVGRDGFLRSSAMRPGAVLENVSDREPFQVQAHAKTDELYIGAPIVGRVTGRLMFLLTRRLIESDGSFGGIIVATVDIPRLQEFYDSIDIGAKGIIALTGFDGIVRARSGNDLSAQNYVGKSAAKTQLLQLYRTAPTGQFWNFADPARQLEKIRRLICYRVVKGYPLLAIVGLAEDDIFRQSTSTAQKYYLIAFLLTASVIGAIALGARRQRKLSSTMTALEQSKLSLEQSKLSLEQTNFWFDTALENMAHGLCMFDKDQRLVVCNERYSEMYGLTPEQTKPGTTFRSILEARVAVGVTPGKTTAYVEERLQQVGGSEPYYVEHELSDGRIFSVNYQPMPSGGWVAVHQEITERKRAERQIAYMARHDALTGIANRAVLIEKVEDALARLRRSGERFAVFMLDLDLFKTINDSLGHPVGDQLLKVVAARLSACVREADTVARLGGDEFAIVASSAGDHWETAVATAKRLLEAVAAPCDIDGHHIDIGTSIGIALAPAHGKNVDQLMKSADLALYKAKAEGRDRYRFFEDAMAIEADTRRTLQSDLRNALTNHELELHYHPIVDLQTMDMAGVEALIRWRHPQRGMIAPGEFIAVAEETGLINPIGEWVLRQACTDAARWPAHVKVSVNLSPVQFRKVSPIEIFQRALADSCLPPERLEVEITESVLLQGSEENVEALHRLRLMGISIVLDDFGTGYSSLSYLKMFPFNKIKIDRSFVHELSNNADSAAIVSAVASLGRSLRMGTVAEGIESEDQLVLVRAAGCTHAQGFLFGQPCPAAELTFRRLDQRKASHNAA